MFEWLKELFQTGPNYFYTMDRERCEDRPTHLLRDNFLEPCDHNWKPWTDEARGLKGFKCHRCGKYRFNGAVVVINRVSDFRCLVEPPRAELDAAFRVPPVSELLYAGAPVVKGTVRWTRLTKAAADGLVRRHGKGLAKILKCRCGEWPSVLEGIYVPHPHVVSYCMTCRKPGSPCPGARAQFIGSTTESQMDWRFGELMRDWNARFGDPDTSIFSSYYGDPREVGYGDRDGERLR
jgi:hypothetical protein